MEKNKIIFKKAISEKSGKAYSCICVDMGYREVTLTFDSAVIAELLDCSPRELATMKVGEERVIGYLGAAEDKGGAK
ncbi:MAG: hypothetical protein NC311_15055 [Muribaculaceae bacterium]|nr:hypothetical protein [Muribaculaceae bacterium]